MNLSQIEAFCTIADTGSVSEAARQLECNRTKLSMSIKALEKDLNIELFVRTGNHVSLSEAGKAIYKDCQNMLVTVSRIRQTCAQVSGEFNAEVWIARDDSLPDDMWQSLSHQLNNKFPATSFNIVLASSGDLANLVVTQQVDFAFGVDYERIDDPHISYHPLGKIRLMSVCKPIIASVSFDVFRTTNCVMQCKRSWFTSTKKTIPNCSLSHCAILVSLVLTICSVPFSPKMLGGITRTSYPSPFA